uniref:bifunctional DNA primase/polymerase n=1 Tax=Streptomyces sp. B21-088 TaxID=3039411 RepID=UPI003FA72B11
MATTDRQTATLALAHALSAAERGLPVFPLSASKLPALRSPHRDETPPVHCRGACGLPGHGVHDATTDPATVRALFAAAPRATGYGIACGRQPHRLIGIDLDIDTTHGNDSVAALRQLALQHLFTIPPTVTVLTPSGGRHLWLTGPPGSPYPTPRAGWPPVSTYAGRAATSSAPARSRPTAGTGSPRARHIWHRPPAPAPSCACSHRHHAPAAPPPSRRPRSGRPGRERAWSSSYAPHTRASATPGCSGPPAARTNTASATTSPPHSPRRRSPPASPSRKHAPRSPRPPA